LVKMSSCINNSTLKIQVVDVPGKEKVHETWEWEGEEFSEQNRSNARIFG